DKIAVKCVGVIGMGGRDEMRDAIPNCPRTHLQGHLPGFRTVVDAVKNMGVDINHESASESQKPRTGFPPSVPYEVAGAPKRRGAAHAYHGERAHQAVHA